MGHAVTEADFDLSGTILDGQFELMRVIGRGGMGEVYLARDMNLGRKVAVKMLHQTKGLDTPWEKRLQQFRRDATATARLQHPNIVTLYHIGTDGQRPFMVLEYLHGQSLSERLEEGMMSAPEALVIIEQVLVALTHAHAQDVVHRDLKPGNVFLRHDGVVKVLDFGVALLQATPEDMREAFSRNTNELAKYLGDSPSSAGTPLYMAPEQLLGEDQDGRVDIWALGVMLYKMLVGSTPFETAFKALVETPKPLSTHRPDVPKEVEDLVMRCLERTPDLRFHDAEDMLEAVRRLLDGPRSLRRRVPSPGMPPGNMVPEEDSFVGRHDELMTLERHWLEGDRLVSIVGPGGTGKSRLALRFATSNAQKFPGGVWFANAADARDAIGLMGAVADVLEIPLEDKQPLDQLGNALRNRGKMLLVLDNVEHLAQHAHRALRTWLMSTTQATFIVTSRLRIGLPEEVTLLLDPLGLPSQDQSDAEIAASPAVQLFVERARQVRPSFGLDEHNAAQLGKLVRMLDGLPLAIELAAARARMLSPEKLLAKLDRRLDVLRDRKATDDRHATLRETIAWSWDLLEPAAQGVFAQLAVFEGGLTFDAAEAVVDLEPFEEDMVFLDEVMEELVEHHLLRALPPLPHDDEPRFGLYSSLQVYARERLEDPASLPGFTGPDAMRSARDRHAAYFSQLGYDEFLESLHVRQHMTIHRLRSERDNLLAALDHILTAGAHLREHAVSLGRAVASLLEATGPWAEGLRLLGEVQKLPGLEGASSQAKLFFARMMLLWRSGRVDESLRVATAAHDLARSAGDRALETRVAMHIGVLASEQGKPDDARAWYEHALAGAQNHGDRRAEGITRAHLAILDQQQGRMDEALSGYHRALDIQQEVGELRQEGAVWGNLGVLQFTRGELNDSEASLQSALARAREVGDRRTEGVLLSNLSVLAKHKGDPESARAMLESSLRVSRELGDQRSEGIALGNLATVHREAGDLDEARRGLERAKNIASQLKDSRWEGYWLGELGELATQQGDLDSALSFLDSAAALFEGFDDRERAARAWCRRGIALATKGALDDARADLARAEQIAQELGVSDDSELGRAIASLRSAIDP